MSFAARSLPPEPDDDDDPGRVAAAVRRARLITLNALANAPIGANSRARKDVLDLRAKLQRDREPLTAKEEERIRQSARKWRRHLPRGTAPKLPPHDPIVRAMEEARV
jgi:hypothetical protein